jgi:hypothetical protein
MTTDALETYLNDHLAGSTLGLDHAKQLASSNEGTPLGALMAKIAGEIDQDRETLIDLMKRVDASENPVKKATAWMAEKAGRVKFSGATSGDQALGNFLALETLSLGVEGKRCLWESLKTVADSHPVLAATDLDTLIARAAEQRATLEVERLKAARQALVA